MSLCEALEQDLVELEAIGRLEGRGTEVALLRQLAFQLEDDKPNAQLVKQFREALEALKRGDGEDEARSFAAIVAGIDAKARGGQTGSGAAVDDEATP